MPWIGSTPNQTYQRSDGTRTGTQVWQEAEADGVDIVSDDHDTHDQDMADSINAALKKDGGNQATANLPMGGYRHTNVGEPAALTQYQTLKGAINGTHRFITAPNVGGTADAITLTTGFGVSAYAAGQQLSFVVEATNTGAATINLDGLGAVALKRTNGNALEPGDLYAGAIALIEHDGTQFQLLNRRVVDGDGGGGDMTGSEIVEAINVALGSDDWQSIATTEVIPAADVDGRVAVMPTTNGHGGAKFCACATEDGRLLVWGDVASFAFNPVGDAYGAYHLPVPWDVATVSIEAIYLGLNYILVQTDEATSNLYHIGSAAYGQAGNGTTTANTAITKVNGLTGIKITRVWTESSRGNAEAFWFALTSLGRLYSCGYSGAQHVMGYNSTANLTTPRLMTESDGTTPLTGIVSMAVDTAYAPVAAVTSGNKLLRWGAGTDGAHGNNSTSAMTWPDYLETSHGSGVDRTDIAQAVVSGSNMATARAVMWIRTTAGKIEVSGSRNFGNGDGAALLSAAVNTFQPATGAIAALTVSALYAGGGEYYNCLAITSTGQGYLCGYMGGYALLGNGSTTNLNTFTILSGLPSGFAGALTDARIVGGNTFTVIYLEATVSSVKTLASIGYDVYYQTAKNTAGVAAASQTWGLVLGTWGTLQNWLSFGTHQEYGLLTLSTDGELRYAGANDQGQAGMRHAPGVLTRVPILQPIDLGVPRILKPPVFRGAYSGATTYSKQDVAENNGSAWIYINDTPGSGNAPPTLPTTSNTYWRLVAAKGDDGVSLNWQGAWQTSTAYAVQDGVENDGSSYICTVAHTSGASTEPGTGASWATVWDLAAAKGDVGSAATIAVGSTTTGAAGSSASVSNTGSSSAAVLAFTIPRGDAGATGAAAPAFIDYSLDPSSTADSDPGNGKLRPNHATAASVTQFFFDDLDRLGVNQASELATWDDSTSSGVKGKLYLIDLTTPANRWTYDVTAFTAATGYSKITATHRAGTAAWPTGNVGCLFVPRGDKGSDGAGTGDVVGPSSATNNSLARFDGTTGKLLKDGAVIGTDVQAYSSVLQNTTASFTTAQQTKLGHITVTQAVDLDAIETLVNGLDTAVVLKGTWDASSGSFPGSGSAQAGWSYIVSTGGTVDSTVFAAGDRIIAIVDNASTSTYASNWFQADYTDQVSSVAGRTGAVTLAQADVSGLTTSDSPQLAGVNVGHATDTTITRGAAGEIEVEGSRVWQQGNVGARINALTTDSAPAGGDFVPSYDTSASGAKKVAMSDLRSEVIVIPVSDEATAITTGTAKVTFRMPFAMTLTAVRASLSTASSSGNPAIDVNDGGTSIFSTTLTIDANEKTSTTAATAAVLSDTSLADDAEITIDIDTAGTGAKGLKVSLIGYRT